MKQYQLMGASPTGETISCGIFRKLEDAQKAKRREEEDSMAADYPLHGWVFTLYELMPGGR